METTRARAVSLFGVLVIAITGIVWHPSTLSGTRYVGLEVDRNNRGTTPIAFEQRVVHSDAGAGGARQPWPEAAVPGRSRARAAVVG